MLDEMTPGQLDEWRAYLDGCGDTDDWKQSAMIAAAVVNGFGQVLAAFGGKFEGVEEEDLIPMARPENCIPPKVRRILAQTMSDKDIAAALGAKFGGNVDG